MKAHYQSSTGGIALLLLSMVTACGDDKTDSEGSGGNSASTGGSRSGSGGERGDGDGDGGADGDGGGDGDGDGGNGGEHSMAAPVLLGEAGKYVILAKAGISTVPPSVITGDVGISPAAATFITGFSLIADATDLFSTSTQVTGSLFAADYDDPTPANLTTAVGDMETALTDAAGRAANVAELGAGDIGGMTLSAGVYKWGTGLLIPSDVTLRGDANQVWIFQIAGDLTINNATSVALAGGAAAENVFWQVSGDVTLGTTAHLEGVVLSQTAITLGTGASIDGRLFAQTAVALDSNTVTEPAQ